MADQLFSTEPEMAVLSILLRNPDLAFDTGNLRFFMLSSIPHQILFTEISELVEKQLKPDIHLLVSSLESSGNLQKVGGKDYLELLHSKEYNPESLQEYIRIVIQSYKARSLVSTTSSVRADKLNIDNVDSTISEIRRGLDGLMESSGGTDTLHVGDNIKGAFDEIVARTNNPGIRGHSWGISSLDIATGGKSVGDLWIIGGRPGSGKTALICNTILEDGKNGVPSLIFEREMNYQTLLERLVAIDTGISIQNIRLGLLTQEQVKTIAESLGKIKKYPIYIDTSYTSDLYYIQNTITRYKKLHDIGVIYLDYLQIISERGENQTQDLGKLSRALKLITLENNICAVALSQLNRGLEMRENKHPIMSDLRQSGNLEEDADFVVGLYRDEYYNKETKFKNLMEFIILKARNGPVGTVTIKFDAESNRTSQHK